MYATDAYPEMIYATAQDRVLYLELDRRACVARRDQVRRRRARLLALCRDAITGR